MRWHHVIALGALVLVVHGTAGLDGGFHYDDKHSVVDNPHIRSLSQIPRFFADPSTFSVDPERGMYRPVLLTTYALDHAVHGGDSRGYLRTNLMLHAVNAVLVAWLAWQLTGLSILSLMAGALFGLHPVTAEPVHYISARSDALVAFFVLLSAGLWLAADRRASWIRRSRWLPIAAALWTKATAVMLPVVLLASDVVRGKHRGRSLLMRHVPVAALVTAYLICIWWSQFLPRSLAASSRGLAMQWLTQMKAVVFYLRLFCWPANGSVHPAFSPSDNLTPTVFCALVLMGTFVFVGAALWRSGFRQHVLAFVWVGAALLPTALLPLNVLFNERRAYLPLVAFAMVAAWAVRRLNFVRGTRGVISIALLTIFGILSHGRGEVWASELTLWKDAVQRGPYMARSRLYLGDAHMDAANSTPLPATAKPHLDAARSAYEAVVMLNPQQHMLSLQAHNGLALLEQEAGHLTAAEARLTQVLAEHPCYVDALVNLGGIHFAHARASGGADEESLQRAIELYQQALRLAPTRYEALLNLGACYHLRGELALAQKLYEETLEMAPDSGMAALNLGTLYLRRSRIEPADDSWILRAREQLERAVRLLPGNDSARQALTAAQREEGG